MYKSGRAHGSPFKYTHNPFFHSFSSTSTLPCNIYSDETCKQRAPLNHEDGLFSKIGRVQFCTRQGGDRQQTTTTTRKTSECVARVAIVRSHLDKGLAFTLQHKTPLRRGSRYNEQWTCYLLRLHLSYSIKCTFELKRQNLGSLQHMRWGIISS